ncbi:ABC transporter permease subunit [Shewanella sp. NIFS-20-20]|uniref:ABC transporter permease subunit n=1 Tax=Shewanella sp. NIFS-20-20 TaxID=2853806 RepID=UPI001C4969BC|nr:ABC transporter permease subunit [Shewanella sp. NIFS-20-20]MBV7314373.1 ABC transporter permease subunit [Shewanella sp. NIFS-20-20]
MTSQHQVTLIAVKEISRTLFTKRGMMGLGVFTGIWLLIFIYPINQASQLITMPIVVELLRSYGLDQQVNALLSWTSPEQMLYWAIGLYLFPLYTLLLCADMFATDKHNGTLKFLTIRTGRYRLFYGRFIGQMFIQFSLVLLAALLAYVMAIMANHDASLTAMISSSLLITISLLPFTGLMALLSLYANSARHASMLAAALLLIASIVSLVINTNFPWLNVVNLVMLGSQTTDLLLASGADALGYIPLPIAQTLVLLIMAYFYLKRMSL